MLGHQIWNSCLLLRKLIKKDEWFAHGHKIKSFPLLSIFHVKGLWLALVRIRSQWHTSHPEIAFIMMGEVEMQLIMWRVW